MPQFKVPQNIDMEDRIIGKFTLKQFGYLVLFGMFGYIALNKLPEPLNVITGGGLFILGFGMAVLKVQDRPLPEFLLSLVVFFFKPRERSWKHEQTTGTLIKKDKVIKKTEQKTQKKQYTRDELANVAELVDSHGYSKLEDE